jgi:2-C-methyl-D-erythritol 4-phosphate cytidylyltransferase
MADSNLTSHPDSYRDLHLISHYAVIVAGGSGTRMQTAIPKQFLLLNGRPVLMHTIEAFYNSDTQPNILLVLHPDFHLYWRELCTEHNFTIPHQLIGGGETRFHSVKNGIDVIPGSEGLLVAVHDAVRPLVTKQIIDGAYRYAAEHGNAVTAVKSRDSVRQLKNNVSTSLARDEIFLVQTPQIFLLSQLKEAYQQPYNARFTDDASVAEAAGYQVHLFEGSFENIKITFPQDIAIAELLLGKVHRP